MGQVAARPLEAHEAVCRRCGRCCYAKLLVGDQVIYTDTPCAHLDLETRLCRVYGRRHEANPDCLSVDEGVRRGVFPADCPYVAGTPGYRAPVEDTDPAVLAAALDALAIEEVGP
ncbi:MAG: CxxCxxCC domain-containing protein [Planctomycetota bacterium]